MSAPKNQKRAIAAPKGTRDAYPEDALRRRYVQQAWRDASLRCGFDEIAGPTFESTELYSVKSGEGILGELFQAFSGKSPEEVEQVRETGRAPYALRPEFTPTLARMYAAKAGSLPKPCKWFTAGPYFRAERPQRGRLREFEQWNVDVIGLPGDANAEGAENAEAKARMDAECVECCDSLATLLGLRASDCVIRISDRGFVAQVIVMVSQPWIAAGHAAPDLVDRALAVLDKRGKVDETRLQTECMEIGFPLDAFDTACANMQSTMQSAEAHGAVVRSHYGDTKFDFDSIRALTKFLDSTDLTAALDTSIVRGLAYYTGTVFEVIAEGERAVAGGGRYDNLIELMGGPPTPAVGFAMGDVVLSLLLDDKGLMPEGADLLDAVSRAPASARPDVFVVGADDDATDPLVRRLAADLRRGVEAKKWTESDDRKPWARDRYQSATGGVTPLHARVSYKSTRNLKKLLADGEKQHARYAAIVHGEDRVELKDLDARQSLTPKDVPDLPDGVAEFSVSPEHEAYVGKAVAALA